MTAQSSLPRLSYFTGRGIAEKIRLLLAESGTEYEDIDLGTYDVQAKVKTPAFEAIKAAGKLAFDKVPLWEEADGFCVVQSLAILRHVARTRGLYGKDAREAAACDMIIEGVEEVSARARSLTSFTPDQLSEMLPLILGEELPQWLAHFERLLKRNGSGDGFFVGTSVTVADTSVFGFLEMLVDNGLQDLLESTYPGLFAFFGRMKERPNLARHLDSPKRHPAVQLLNG
ncbi:glutathione S-transferase family protein [Corallococcus macrosporus]|uniref:Glutathione S-transferase n=1 Tax=Corallococcus macrosporus DSM 14697 TaxID=1189310 RepID=A0A250JVM8_9BACT|nr:glutathione S-transferase family protein [Corallococcus macrosporus]ATB47929.1 glutathione S-transferase [Corallococcus macrosporus DSM 14697]